MPGSKSTCATAADRSDSLLRINWGAVALGAMGGLGMALVAFAVLGLTGLTNNGAGAAALVVLQYSAQIAGGYLGGRMAGRARVLHGGLAGLLMAVLGIAIGLAFTGPESDIGLVVLALVIALTTGSAGGALAEYLAARRAEADLQE